MLVKDRLAVKLPRPRVELVAGGAGTNLDTGNGRVMREWLELAPDSDLDWLELAGEARQFVGGH